MSQDFNNEPIGVPDPNVQYVQQPVQYVQAPVQYAPMPVEPPKKKKRTWLWVVLGLILLPFIIRGCGGSNDTPASPPPPPAATPTAPAATNEPATQPEPEAEAEAEGDHIVGVGQELVVGDWTFVVNSVETASVVGQHNQFLQQEASGEFLIVNVSATNNGNTAGTMTSSFFKLLADGAEFDPADAMVNMAANPDGSSFLLENVNPRMSITGNLVFDVPPSIAEDPDAQLRVQTGFWGTQRDIIRLR